MLLSCLRSGASLTQVEKPRTCRSEVLSLTMRNEVTDILEEIDQLDPCFRGMLRAGRLQGQYEYFMDRKLRWPFVCEEYGMVLLVGLLKETTKLLTSLRTALGARASQILDEGRNIYAEKRYMTKESVTWSQEEYKHPGLQFEYLCFKSLQRFTETWAMLQRAQHWGLFDTTLMSGKRRVRVASIGGGPGFELLAFQRFFEFYYPNYQLELISLDVEESWRKHVEGLGLRFEQWDVKDGAAKLEDKCRGAVQFAIISYVFYHYMSNNECYDWLANWLLRDDESVVKGPDALFVSSRQFGLQPQVENMRRRGVRVQKLMEQATTDDRQLLFMPPKVEDAVKTAREHMTTKPPMKLTFPNVPYVDSKEQSHFAADRHGHTAEQDSRRPAPKGGSSCPARSGSYVPPHRR
mmetsp:Transcript_13977/g.50866  ORF Transcript_13977/g.50866 Transcript_13977/m.50866 type:complete len:407 (-) Transcript_13977:729-1949(-)